MKTSEIIGYRVHFLRRIVLIGLLLLLVPAVLMARGAAEADKPYGMVLTDEFMTVLEQIVNDEIDVPSAMETIRSLRQDFGRHDNEDYKSMEQILMAVQTKVMTKEQAREEFCRLEESREGLTGLEIRVREQKMSRLHEEKRSGNMPETIDPPIRESGEDTPRQEARSGKQG